MPKAAGPLLFVLVCLLGGCGSGGRTHAPPKDDGGYYGPIIRDRDDIPAAVASALCKDTPVNRCIANPDKQWASSDVNTSGPLRQILWVRRMGQTYVAYYQVGGFNIIAQLSVLQPRDGGYVETWSPNDYHWNIDAKMRNAPEDIDPKVEALVRYLVTDPNPCPKEPHCPRENEWPYR